MKKKALPMALACLAACGTAHAIDCTKPPFGDSDQNYQQFVLNGEVASKGDLKLAQFITVVEKLELMSACDAKYHKRGIQKYNQMGLSKSDLSKHSVVEIASYAMNWKARQGNTALNQTDASPRRISVQQFAIEGPKLASEGIKVLVSGSYIREGDAEFLYTNSTAIEMQMAPGSPMYEPHIPLLTNDASDQARTKFLSCSEDPAASQVGCSVTIEGTATNCEQTSAFGGKRSLPCIDVKDIRP